MQYAYKTMAITCILITGICRLCMAQTVTINTMVIPPVNAYINQAFITNGPGIHVTITASESITINLYGSLRRLSPSGFSIRINPDFTPSDLSLNQGEMKFLDNALLEQAFANFNEQNLITENISFDDLKEGSSYKLPAGFYEICFEATSDGEVISNRSCATFYICDISAPQITQPVNNLIANPSITIVQPASPIIFSWLPPQSSCGLPASIINYDFEIKEILDGQTITDALNNPYIFRKTALATTIFSLDTNLYQHILQQGSKYIMQVQAKAMGSLSPTIENNGYSRVEAFQYGGNDMFAGQLNLPDPGQFYLPFNARKTDVWDKVLAAYINHTGNDTLIPVNEYIAFALMEKGIAYNISAIELFLSLNPEVAGQKRVKLSYKPKFPDFPLVSAAEKEAFDLEYSKSLKPDTAQFIKFNHYFDSLKDLKSLLPVNAVEPVNKLMNNLTTISEQSGSYSGTLLGTINEVLSELLYNMRRYSKALNNTELTHLQSLLQVIEELGAAPPPNNALSNRHLRTYRLPVNAAATAQGIFYHAGYSYTGITTTHQPFAGKQVLASEEQQVLPFKIVIWRNSKQQPYKPVTDAPDLTDTYKIYYILDALFDHKNPQIGSKSSNSRASTANVQLAANVLYRFWASNGSNQQSTEPEKVDLRNILNNSKNEGTKFQKATIVLKVK